MIVDTRILWRHTLHCSYGAAGSRSGIGSGEASGATGVLALWYAMRVICQSFLAKTIRGQPPPCTADDAASHRNGAQPRAGEACARGCSLAQWRCYRMVWWQCCGFTPNFQAYSVSRSGTIFAQRLVADAVSPVAPYNASTQSCICSSACAPVRANACNWIGT